ncbi:MAG TPA: phage holin family protein [Candidatus Tectomicrobia bacterium]|nr:phage holin family protein [Candidatus Tectomicrobia bacterium]
MNSSPYHTEPTLAQLVSDLLDDAKLLLRQELALAKYEIHQEVHKTKMALVSLGVGIGIAAIGGLLLIVMLVHLLHALSELPLWSCYAIVGGACAIVGIVLLYRGKQQISQIDMIPQQTVETMKENVRWIKKSTISEKI